MEKKDSFKVRGLVLAVILLGSLVISYFQFIPSEKESNFVTFALLFANIIVKVFLASLISVVLYEQKSTDKRLHIIFLVVSLLVTIIVLWIFRNLSPVNNNIKYLIGDIAEVATILSLPYIIRKYTSDN